ncbi:hypothetical protein VTJ83DRAFT_784 [Remersonia thermophila]|uniref:Uncharacterized protein n=1 Tax=Remersonia thermophila TaxID=72144 RepID=A0ABR4DMA9_9PEZI
MGSQHATSGLPPIRACLFDMDGLLLNTEDIYSLCANKVLAKYNRPPLPWSVKAKLMGVPGGSNGDVFHAWAQLPISREQYAREQAEHHAVHFPECEPLPGATELLAHLTGGGRGGESAAAAAARNVDGRRVRVALASSTATDNFALKTSRPAAKGLLDMIPENLRVLGDDPRVRPGRGKPAPDIYLLALDTINAALREENADEPPITPAECLVFEDSVPGVEAGRRAGMRVVWVPHEKLWEEWKDKAREVLAGRTGLVPELGDEHQLGQLDDGWAERLETLEGFPYERFGIQGP